MTKLELAIAAINEGKKQLALDLLKQELSSNPTNVNAMLLVAQIADDLITKEKWFRFVLIADPQNAHALSGLKKLSEKTQTVSQPSSTTTQQPIPNSSSDAQSQQGVNNCPQCGEKWQPVGAQCCRRCGYSPNAKPAPSTHHPATKQKPQDQLESPKLWLLILAWTGLFTGFAITLLDNIITNIIGFIVQLCVLSVSVIWSSSVKKRGQGLPLLISWIVFLLITLIINIKVYWPG